jgi:hypothetical protein
VRTVRFLAVFVIASSASAHEPDALPPASSAITPCNDCFCEWSQSKPPCDPCSLQILTGYYTLVNGDSARASFLPDGTPNGLHDFAYAPQIIRLGHTCHYYCPGAFWPTVATSVHLEFSGATILQDFGSYLAGPSLLTRFTFSPERSWHPYIQGGVGVLFNDADEDLSQRMIGSDVEYVLQAQAGLQFMINKHCSLDIEGGYQHISNAGRNDRNFGVNAVGASVGLSYRFGGSDRRRDGSPSCSSCSDSKVH